MKILLTHGYFLEDDPNEKIIMKPYVPLGILYVSAFLEQKGFSNSVFDTTFSSMPQLQKYLLEFNPDVLAVYVNLMTKLNVLKIIKFVKDNLNNTKIILGGPEIRYNAEDFLNHGADYLVIGEGEETCFELIKTLNDKKKPKMSQKTRTFRGLALLAALILFSQPVFAGTYGENLRYGLKRGVKNVLTAPAEMAVGFQEYHERAGWPFVRQFAGIGIGAGKMLLRFGSGVVDLGAAWIPGLQGGIPVKPEVLF